MSSLGKERDFGGRQSQGDRPYQEDSYAFSLIEEDGIEKGLLLVLADGMGGAEAGDQASSVAVSAFVDSFHYALDEGEHAKDALGLGLTAANNAIEAEIALGPDHLDGMGTTLVGICLANGNLSWISVGDSPLYLFRQGKLSRLNEDHSMREVLRQQVKAGVMTVDDARSNPDRNALLSAVIGKNLMLIDWPEESLGIEEGDVFILASDGLETLSDFEIVSALEDMPGADAAEVSYDLVRRVLDVGKKGQDNVTIAVVMAGEAAMNVFTRTLSSNGRDWTPGEVTDPLPESER